MTTTDDSEKVVRKFALVVVAIFCLSILVQLAFILQKNQNEIQLTYIRQNVVELTSQLQALKVSPNDINLRQRELNDMVFSLDANQKKFSMMITNLKNVQDSLTVRLLSFNDMLNVLQLGYSTSAISVAAVITILASLGNLPKIYEFLETRKREASEKIRIKEEKEKKEKSKKDNFFGDLF